MRWRDWRREPLAAVGCVSTQAPPATLSSLAVSSPRGVLHTPGNPVKSPGFDGPPASGTTAKSRRVRGFCAQRRTDLACWLDLLVDSPQGIGGPAASSAEGVAARGSPLAWARPRVVQKASYPTLNVGITIVFNPSRLVMRRSAPTISPFRRAFSSLRLIKGYPPMRKIGVIPPGLLYTV